MALHVRAATPDDASALTQLRYEFRSATGAPSEAEEVFLARCEAWMAPRLAPGSPWRCWVLEDDGKLAGNLWLQIIEKIPNPAPELEAHAYITNVYVRPVARGSGGGEMLLAAAMDWCRANAIDSVILWPTMRSRSLYARAGFAVRDDIVEAVLHPGRALDYD